MELGVPCVISGGLGTERIPCLISGAYRAGVRAGGPMSDVQGTELGRTLYSEAQCIKGTPLPLPSSCKQKDGQL